MDAIIGFITSGVLSLTSTGVPSTNSCRAEYAQGNADTVRAFTSATRSLTRAPPSPLCTRDNLVNTEIALERQKLAHRDLTLTQHVQANGLSTVEVAQMTALIDVVVDVFTLGSPPSPLRQMISAARVSPWREERLPPARGV